MNQNNFIKNDTPIAEGKTKIIWGIGGHPLIVIMEAKNATTADNNPKKTKELEQKAKCATITTSRVFELLEKAGIPTAYVKQLSDTEILAKKCTMIPLEVIIRRDAYGSSLDRNPHLKRQGNSVRFHRLIFELFLKTSHGKLGEFDLRHYLPKKKEEIIKYLNVVKTLQSLQKENPDIHNLMDVHINVLIDEAIKIIDDPWIENPYDIEKWSLRHPKKPTWDIVPLTEMNGINIIDTETLEKIEELTRKTFLLLEGAWNTLGYRLIDFKIEFGVTENGELVVADVIDNDSWRLQTPDGKEISKQTFRDGHPLAEVEANYIHVASVVDQFKIPKQAIILWRGSDTDSLECFADEKFLKTIPVGITLEDVVISVHKKPVKAKNKLNELHQKYPEGAVIIPIIGMSNGAGPMISARTTWPALSYCATAQTNPEDVWSSLRMPSFVPNATFLNLKNAYLQALNNFSSKNPVAYMTRQYAIEEFDE